LTVVRAGGGEGAVASEPDGIACGAACIHAYPVGATETLTASPTGSSRFTGWSGGSCSGVEPCTLRVDADVTVTATFVEELELTVATDGTGAGTVTSTPGGIDCGADCSERYLAGTQVTLTATADASSSFAGWGGAGCSGTGPCVVT